MDQSAAKYEQDRVHWMEVNTSLEEELKELKSKINSDRWVNELCISAPCTPATFSTVMDFYLPWLKPFKRK
jgi:hypothetical protein